MQYSSHIWHGGTFGRWLVPACVALLCAAQRAPAVERAQRLAVVNVSYVFEKYAKVADVQRRIDAQHDTRKKDLTQRAKSLQDRNRDMEERFKQPGASSSEEVFDALQRLRKEQFIYERDIAQLNAQIAKDYTREMREVLSEIRQSIKAIAEANSFDIVLRSPDTDDPTLYSADPKAMTDPAAKDKQTYLQLTAPQTVGDVLERFHRNPVLFGSTTVDITEEVLRSLNAAFEKRARGGK